MNPRSRLLSFKYAMNGFYIAFKEEPNLKIHFTTAILIVFLNFILQVSKSDWIFITLLLGLVLSAELTNTAIEAIVDSFTDKYHPGAKKAKDVAAAAVLTVTITSIIVGLLIYTPYILQLIK